MLERGAKVNEANGKGERPLHLCCQSGMLETAQILCKAGADVNLSDLRGDAPIHVACKVIFIKK